MIENIDKNNELKNDIEKTRKQYAMDFSVFYKFKCEEIDNLSVLKWAPHNPPNITINSYIKLAGQFFYALLNAFYQLVECYAYSIAAEQIVQSHFKIKNTGYATTWKYDFRNYHFYMFIPRFYNIIDYSAFLINELSNPELLVKDNKNGEPKQVDYESVKMSLNKVIKDGRARGSLSVNDLSICCDALDGFFENITDHGKQIIKRYRDIITHRYLPGIDCIMTDIERTSSKTRIRPDHGRLFSIADDTVSYQYYGVPEFKFEELQPLAKLLILSADKSLNKIYFIEPVKKAFTEIIC